MAGNDSDLSELESEAEFEEIAVRGQKNTSDDSEFDGYAEEQIEEAERKLIQAVCERQSPNFTGSERTFAEENYDNVEEVSETGAPLLCFWSFWWESNKIDCRTNKFVFKKTSKPLDADVKEIEQIIGILLFMGIVDTSIVANLHFADNDNETVDKTDRLWKIRPYLEHLDQVFWR